MVASRTKIRVVHIYRWSGKNGTSIERLFSAIASALPPSIEVVPLHLSAKWLDPQDIVRLHRLKADVYHVTGDCHQIAWFLPWVRTIVTVHDLNHCLHELHGLRRRLFRYLWYDGPLARVGTITVVSEHTRRQLARYCPALPAQAVEVIPNCVPHLPVARPKPFDRERPCILQVGTAPHKNLRRVARALVGLPCRLLVIGPLSSADRGFLERSGIEFEAWGRVDDATLGRAYQESDVVAFVSEREGFGLPIIEAQAVGRPVVTSDRPPMRDVAGKAAMLVDPENVDGIRNAILRLIREDGLRQHLIADGFRNAQLHAPRTVARHYAALYHRVAATLPRRDAHVRVLPELPG